MPCRPSLFDRCDTPFKIYHTRTKNMAKTKDPKAERHQIILAEMLKEEDNKYCADCAMKGNVT